jgi:hypothetical protein
MVHGMTQSLLYRIAISITALYHHAHFGFTIPGVIVPYSLGKCTMLKLYPFALRTLQRRMIYAYRKLKKKTVTC